MTLQPNKLAGEGRAPLFFARSGEVFQTPGYYLNRAEAEHMVSYWRAAEGCDAISRLIRSDMADDLEAAIAAAEAQVHGRQAA